MPIILKTAHDRLAARFRRQSALRSPNSTVDQLQAQLEAERQQHAFNMAEMERQVAVLMRDLMRAEYKLARREMVDAIAEAPSQSEMTH